MVEDWGFQNEESKRIFEARLKKAQYRKNKSKKLTAEQKYQRFLYMKERGGGM